MTEFNKFNIKIRYYKFKALMRNLFIDARDLVHLYVEPRLCVTLTLSVCVAPQSFESFIVIMILSHLLQFQQEGNQPFSRLTQELVLRTSVEEYVSKE